jgi:hypothetical protein
VTLRDGTAKSIIANHAMEAATDRDAITTSNRMQRETVDSKCSVAHITPKSPPSRRAIEPPHDELPRRPPKVRSESWRFVMVMAG